MSNSHNPQKKRIECWIPADVVERLDQRARRQLRSRSNLIAHLVREALGHGDAPQPTAA